MEYMFKYDVYGKVENKEIKILELIPIKRRYVIKLKDDEVSSAKQLIDLLNRGTTSKELENLVARKATMQNILHFFKKQYLLANYFGDNHSDDPFARQIEMLDSFNRSGVSTSKLQTDLSQKSVLIIGAGGVGTSLSNLLNSCGIGHIYIIDADIIENTNLSRQFLYNRDDIGKPKVEVLSHKLNKRGLGKVTGINTMLTLSNYNNILKDIGKVDLITGMPFPFSSSLNKLYRDILSLGYTMYAIGEHDAGPLFNKFNDIDKIANSIIAKYPATNFLNQRRDSPARHDRHPSFLPEIQITSSLAAAEIVKYFTQVTTMNTENAMYSLHSDNYTVSLVKF